MLKSADRIKPYNTKGSCSTKTVRTLYIIEEITIVKILSFMLRTNLATRRTFVRLRANKNKSEALFLLGLSVLHLFPYPINSVAETPPFSTSSLFFYYPMIYLILMSKGGELWQTKCIYGTFIE